MSVVVTGIGLLSALGNFEMTWKRLLAGESGILQHQPFSAIAARPLGLIGAQPISLEVLTEQIVRQAVEDAGLAMPLPKCGVVVGSSRGNQARWERLAAASNLPDPVLTSGWLDSLPHAAALVTARVVGTQASVRSPMSACATGLWAIAQGYELVRSGQFDCVIAGAIEAPITPLTLTGFAQMGALAQTGAYPFDSAREGLVLGEGGAVFVLETEQTARKRSARIYGRIMGFGLTADAYHVSAPNPDNRAAISAVTQCLKCSGLSREKIHYIHAHGTATQLNDRNEARLIQTLFPVGVPVSSTKGATGHTIGASGALGVAFSLLALQHQLLPPNVGLRQAEFDLDLVMTSRPERVNNVLCFSFGFGGQNAAIALSR